MKSIENYNQAHNTQYNPLTLTLSSLSLRKVLSLSEHCIFFLYIFFVFSACPECHREPPPLIIVRVKAPGAWCAAGTNTSNYVTISVKGLALGHKHQLTLGIPAAHRDPMARITDQMLHNIDTHKIFLLHFLRFCGIAEVWYHKAIEEDVKGSAGNVRNAASRCVDTGSYFILLGKYTFVRSKHGEESWLSTSG